MGSLPGKAYIDTASGATSLADALNAEEDLSEDGDAPYIAAIAKDMERQVCHTACCRKVFMLLAQIFLLQGSTLPISQSP